jgi:hypothetical protein
MREITVKRKSWERRDRHHQAPILEGINEAVTLIDEASGEKIAVQYLLEETLVEERRQLSRQLRFGVSWNDEKSSKSTGSRQGGMKYAHRVFGTTAPVLNRRRYGCTYSTFNTDYPDIYSSLKHMTLLAWETLEQQLPQQAEEHHRLVSEEINKDWWINDVPFTSAIINNTAALPYHRDRLNIKGSLSAMLCLRSKVGGGHLDLPEYGVTLGIPDGSLTMFDGQKAWHGVTPLVNERPDAYRFTIVWYAKSECKGCGPAKDEAQRAAQKATDRTDLK